MLLQDLLGQFDPTLHLNNLPTSPVAAVREELDMRRKVNAERRSTRRSAQIVVLVSVGLALGATGELPINRHLGFLAEVSGHYIHFRDEQFFAMGHLGIALHF